MICFLITYCQKGLFLCILSEKINNYKMLPNVQHTVVVYYNMYCTLTHAEQACFSQMVRLQVWMEPEAKKPPRTWASGCISCIKWYRLGLINENEVA